VTVSWAEIEKGAAGLDLGATGWRSVAQEQVEHFAQATGDFQFIHVDPERAAREGPFGGPVAHGYLLLSMMPVLLAELITFPPGVMVVNYGLERLRFSAPVLVGQKFRGRFAVKGRNRMEQGKTILKIHASVEVEDAARPAITVDPLIALVIFPGAGA
jgi:acyl dehydratase